ncbi:hypothetical protein LV779_36525 [Streptomyces thinghirensis]|nr:hypothetical protein [Streptomyces thinghirensis]
MRLLRDLQDERNMAVVLITHDLAVVAQRADDVVVMYAGTVVEKGTAREVFSAPRHPYTRGLLDSVPEDAVRGQPLPASPAARPELSAVPSGCVFQGPPPAGAGALRPGTAVPARHRRRTSGCLSLLRGARP